MVRLVDDLLDVSRIDRGVIELRRQSIELASVIHHAMEAARPLCESRNHTLTVSLPTEPIYLDADPIRMAQIVENLLTNACKFTHDGGRISLTVERESGEAVIRIRDNGIGISADQLPKLFDMFMQVDTSLERSVNGLGIGLTLVRHLARLHGGRVDAESAGIGLGSVFTVRLPILANTPDQPMPADNMPKSTAARRILVVDDNHDSARTLELLLKQDGHEVRTAYDGVEAVETATTFLPDVILLDIGLPKLNGYDACRRIREQPWSKGMMLVALTGWGQDEDRQKSRDAGFNDHIVKPVKHDALTKLLTKLDGASRDFIPR
jgi:CheY-like chemotaxis protein